MYIFRIDWRLLEKLKWKYISNNNQQQQQQYLDHNLALILSNEQTYCKLNNKQQISAK